MLIILFQEDDSGRQIDKNGVTKDGHMVLFLHVSGVNLKITAVSHMFIAQLYIFSADAFIGIALQSDYFMRFVMRKRMTEESFQI